MNLMTIPVNETRMRILLAEDEPDVRAFLVRALACICPHAEIVAVTDGLEALEALHEQPIDLVISDHHMPCLRGLELLEALRRSSEVPFVLLSADSGVAEAALASGASYFLEKPFALSDLRRAVETLAPAV
jgi:CheY-like chemotaxis protein